MGEVRGSGRHRDDEEEGTSTLEQLRAGETFLYFSHLAAPFDLQVGRQDFDDEREWLYDRNLDGLRRDQELLPLAGRALGDDHSLRRLGARRERDQLDRLPVARGGGAPPGALRWSTGGSTTSAASGRPTSGPGCSPTTTGWISPGSPARWRAAATSAAGGSTWDAPSSPRPSVRSRSPSRTRSAAAARRAGPSAPSARPASRTTTRSSTG